MWHAWERREKYIRLGLLNPSVVMLLTELRVQWSATKFSPFTLPMVAFHYNTLLLTCLVMVFCSSAFPPERMMDCRPAQLLLTMAHHFLAGVLRSTVLPYYISVIRERCFIFRCHSNINLFFRNSMNR
jgi:hypothetical protein